jgi:ABC-2 type transport system permease protein
LGNCLGYRVIGKWRETDESLRCADPDGIAGKTDADFCAILFSRCNLNGPTRFCQDKSAGFAEQTKGGTAEISGDRVNALLDVYLQQFKTTLAAQVQYRAALVIWMISHVLEPVIYLVVWDTVARSSGGRVGAYTTGDLAAYFILLMLVNHATFTWIMYEYDYRITHGELSFALLRPIHPIHADIADNVSFKLITFMFMLPIAAGLAIVFRATLHSLLWAVAAFVPALLLAFIVRFLVEWTLAMAAFWTTRVNAINQIYYVAVLFLSGQVAPLALFPFPIQVIAALLPFRWMVEFPVDLMLGHLTPVETLIGFAAQAVWLVLSLVLLRIVWRAGVRQYSAVGS